MVHDHAVADSVALPFSVKCFFSASLICLSLCYWYLLSGVTVFTDVSNNISDEAGSGATRRVFYIPTRDGTLTRLGSHLQFDYETCPRSSLMVNGSRDRSENAELSTALHDDCPKVYIIGAKRGGTTSLIKYLSEHPNFTAANINSSHHALAAGETGYFSRFYYKSWAYYKEQFIGDGEVLGDSSVNNLVNCHVPGRMYKACGENMKSMKFIVLLRNPVERFQSHFRFRDHVHNGFSTRYSAKNRLSLSSFVEREIDRYYEKLLKRGLDLNGVENQLNKLQCLFIPSMNAIYEGLYLFHLDYWLCNVPAENVLILNSEEFFNQTAEIFSEVIDFIGLSPLSKKTILSIVSKNPALELEDSENLLSQTEYLQIQDIYQPFNAKLFELLQWPDSLWS